MQLFFKSTVFIWGGHTKKTALLLTLSSWLCNLFYCWCLAPVQLSTWLVRIYQIGCLLLVLSHALPCGIIQPLLFDPAICCKNLDRRILYSSQIFFIAGILLLQHQWKRLAVAWCNLTIPCCNQPCCGLPQHENDDCCCCLLQYKLVPIIIAINSI